MMGHSQGPAAFRVSGFLFSNMGFGLVPFRCFITDFCMGLSFCSRLSRNVETDIYIYIYTHTHVCPHIPVYIYIHIGRYMGQFTAVGVYLC